MTNRHIPQSERPTSPITDEERAAYADFVGGTLSRMSLTVWVIRRRELQQSNTNNQKEQQS